MDILKNLKESGKDLYPEDLDLFETELATGGTYNASYKAQCQKLIKELRKWMKEKDSQPDKDSEKEGGSIDPLLVSIMDLSPQDTVTEGSELSAKAVIQRDIAKIRQDSNYKSLFKKYVTEKTMIDSEFVDANYSIFQQWELDAIISVRQMTEEFLEKYFGALDHDKIARYQQFSEAFFLKHYSQMDANIVLEHGKNEWRKKENRSQKLDVFLRLKGVKI